MGGHGSVLEKAVPDRAATVLDAGHPLREQALRLVVGAEGGTRAVGDQDLRRLLRSVELQGLVLDPVVGVIERGRVVSAGAAFRSPGRAALVFVGPHGARSGWAPRVAACLREVTGLCFAADVTLVQSLLVPAHDDLARLHRDAGFSYLAELIYMDRRVSDLPPVDPGRALHFVGYAPQRETQFVATLERTYRNSLDCPGLAGLRATRDVLLGHRHTGVFDPRLWYLAFEADRPVGIVLLSQVPEQRALEVVYMGVDVDFRGRGIGDALMGAAFRAAREGGFAQVTLAVDSTNTHALRLYRRWRFVETARRRAWIAHRRHHANK